MVSAPGQPTLSRIRPEYAVGVASARVIDSLGGVREGTTHFLSKSSMTAQVLLVGAYERDNFGDLLFYELTREYFDGHTVLAGSVIGADMTRLIGIRVHPHNDLLATRAFDLVWVVGGEIGGVDTRGALAMSLSDEDGSVFDGAGMRGKELIARFLSGAGADAPAYLPVLSRFPANADTPLVLNSVGLGNLRPAITAAGAGTVADPAIPVIRGAAEVVVRDSASLEVAGSIGTPARLVPDMVHAISLRHPELALPSSAGATPFFVFQCNAHLILEYGAEAIAQALASVAAVTGWRPAFFLAGTARHHDRADQYAEITATLKRISPNLVPMTMKSRRPVALASFIARSQLWVGSSLHGRIISGSFGLPRVSLTNTKVETYAATWDSVFPVGVGIENLGAAVSEAIAIASRPAAVQASADLARLADRSTCALVEEFL